MLKVFIQKLMKHENLTQQEITLAMNCIMEGSVSEVQIAAFLAALGSKGETVEEITGCVKVMRDKSEKITSNMEYSIDTCGTGGDGAGTFNVSTAAAIVAAAGGAKVAKHGNRAMSSRSGSADVLEALGIDIMLSARQAAECIEAVGIGFLFAQSYHKSMRHAAGVRKDMGVKTIFNILGPMTNPAGVQGQVMGVFDGRLTEKIANVLNKLGTERALIVHGLDGLDEITITNITKISELKNGRITSYYLDAADLGIARCNASELKGGDAKHNAGIIKAIFQGEMGPKRDMVVINSAAALYIAKLADSIQEGVHMAEEIIASGKALAKLEQLSAFTGKIQSDREVPA